MTQSQLLVSLTGWTVLALGALQVTMPWIVRDRRIFRNHYGIGFMIVVLSFLHASVAVSTIGIAGGLASLGIAIATLGMFGAAGQVSLGMRLRAARAPRTRLRRFHLVGAAVLAGAAVAHLALNSSLFR
ncbi:MAG: hypothetical protein ACREOM_06345 [Candidatus Dormibacteraceae bacterium]